MYQRIKKENRKIRKTVIVIVVALLFAVAAKAQSKQSDIVGVWEGRYSSSGKVTLTVNVDMTGVFDFINAGKSGSYKVSVEFSNGRYNVIGKEWIDRPSSFVFYNLNRGVINKDVFRGTDFQLERVATAIQLQVFQAERERQLESQRIEQEKLQEEQQKQMQLLQEKREKEQKTQSIIYTIIAVVLSIIFIKLPKEQQKAILRVIGVICVFVLTLVTFGIFSGINKWKNDR